MELPQPSPLCTFTQKIGLTDVEVVYSRPGTKGRKVFGEVVPFDKLWRTGANATTKIKFSTDVKLEGHDLPAGQYALFSIPGKSEWTVIVGKVVGPPTQYDEKNDVVRFKVKPTELHDTVETFRIELRDLKDESGLIVLEWEKTAVPLRIQVETLSRVIPEIEKATSSGQKLEAIEYFRCAMFYLNHDLDVNKAADWVQKGLEQNSNFQWLLMHAHAKVLAKKGDKAGALKAATEAKAAAEKVEGPGGAFGRMNNEIIQSMK